MQAQETFQVARATITFLMGRLREFGMTEEETRHKITPVGNKKVIFEVHDALKKRIKNYLRSHKLQHATMAFCPNTKNKSLWEIVVQVDGVESAFFASILEAVVQMEAKSAMINAGKDLIEKTIGEILEKFTPKGEIYKEIYYKKRDKVFHVYISIDQIYQFGEDDAHAEVLCEKLNDALPELIRMAKKSRSGKKK